MSTSEWTNFISVEAVHAPHLFSTVIGGLGTPLMVVSLRGDVVYANALAAHGWARGARTHEPVRFQALWREGADVVAAVCRTVASQTAWRPFTLHAAADGRRVDLKGCLVRPELGRQPSLIVVMGDPLRRDTFRRRGDGERRSMGEQALRSLSDARRELRLAHMHQREIVHRTKNHLALLGSLVRLAQRNADTDPADALAQFESRIAAMTAVHTVLDRTGRGGHVRADELLGSLCGGLRDAMAGDSVRVVTRLDAVTVDVADAIPLCLVANEAVTNALKHAFPAGRSGRVCVSLSTGAGEQLRLSVRDNGVGAPKVRPSRRGSGSRIIALLADQLGAELASGAASDGGYNVDLVFRPRVFRTHGTAEGAEREPVAAA
ncbi:MAG: sensor histidine kinase [Pseudomonadota bacterium]